MSLLAKRALYRFWNVFKYPFFAVLGLGAAQLATKTPSTFSEFGTILADLSLFLVYNTVIALLASFELIVRNKNEETKEDN